MLDKAITASLQGGSVFKRQKGSCSAGYQRLSSNYNITAIHCRQGGANVSIKTGTLKAKGVTFYISHTPSAVSLQLNSRLNIKMLNGDVTLGI